MSRLRLAINRLLILWSLHCERTTPIPVEVVVLVVVLVVVVAVGAGGGGGSDGQEGHPTLIRSKKVW